jgi:hypothetical protein
LVWDIDVLSHELAEPVAALVEQGTCRDLAESAD